uniref:Uncharacterized protein n=1 Tax=Gossypium raimondii TaxID=29730 RepID=A0A0D2LV60_GOSRA|nr:hypothetical protein B456_001G055100 [Gossypium raimondii]
MASRLAMLKHSAATDYGSFLGLRRWIHASALPPPLGAPIGHPPPSQSLVFPESDQTPESNNNSNIGFGFGFGFGFPSFPLGGGSMELMAVPKKKVRMFFKIKRWFRMEMFIFYRFFPYVL